jgi:hypothetical protein
MNVVLWIGQVVMGLAFLFVGGNKIFRQERSRAIKGMEWMAAVPARLITFIGVCEVLGGLGLVLPAATGILPWLTPLAAGLLTLVMALAAGFHARRREPNNLSANLVLGVLTALIALGRWLVVPL